MVFSNFLKELKAKKYQSLLEIIVFLKTYSVPNSIIKRSIALEHEIKFYTKVDFPMVLKTTPNITHANAITYQKHK